ncbi:MAG: hypothetical protein ACE5KM_17900, partial [Planctomycetaceae bacterium]
VESGKVPGAEIDPWELGTTMTEDFGFGGGAGGFDPGVPIAEQIGKKKQQGRGKDDDGKGDGSDKNETFHDISDVAPEIVDPPPEPINKDSKSAKGLWDVDVSKNASSNAKQSFVLMQPTLSNLGGKQGARRSMSARSFNFGALGNGIAAAGPAPTRTRPARPPTLRIGR